MLDQRTGTLDERDVSQNKRWRLEMLGKKAVSGLKKRGIKAEFLPEKEQALERVLELVPPGATVGMGDSVTLHQVGVMSSLKAPGRNVVWDALERNEDGAPKRPFLEMLEIMRSALTADCFLCSVVAITLDGKMLNTDSLGNRVAATIFGPRKLIIVAGANKIVKDLDEAMERRRAAAAINCHRHLHQHKSPGYAKLPCVQTGSCADCLNPERICHFTVIIEGEKAYENYAPRIHVLIVGEELGI